jgi:hypothetical protein
LAGLAVLVTSSPSRTAAPAIRSARAPAAAYGELPIGFEPNRGQSSPAARFLARGPGYGLFLGPDRAVLSLEAPGGAAVGPPRRDAALALDFLGANPHPEVTGAKQLGGEVNYIYGDGRPDVSAPTFGAVRYAGLWPGIGMRFYGNRGHLEYDFDLAPGASAGEIGLRFRGQRSAKLAADGTLLLRLGSRLVTQPPPRAFQVVGGARRPIPSHYRLGPEGSVTIAVADYDHQRPLTIDPQLDYSTYLGRGILGWATSIAVGRGGSAYLTGSTPSSHFPRTLGTFPAKPKRRAAFVTKINRSGTGIVYSTILSGRSGSHGGAIAVDAAGDAFVAGSASSTDFPRPRGSFIPAKAGREGAFVAKLDPSGRHLLYAAYLGRRGGSSGVSGLAIDHAGNAYVTGMTGARHFPTSATAFQPTDPHEHGAVGYVAKLNPAGSRLLYSTFLSGTRQRDLLEAIAVDRSGHAYLTGWAQSRDYPTTRGAFQTRLSGPYHEGILVTKLNRTGTKLGYSTFISGGQNEAGTAIAVDGRGRAYIAGETESTTYPTTRGAYQEKLRGSRDFVVSALSPDGRRLEASTLFGAGGPGGLASEASAIGLLPGGDVVVAGTTNSTHLRTTANALQPKSHSRYYDNSVIAVLSPDLRRKLYASYFAGGTVTHIRGLAVGPSGAVFVAGSSNPGLHQTRGHLPRFHDPRFKTHPNAFVAKFDLDPGRR